MFIQLKRSQNFATPNLIIKLTEVISNIYFKLTRRLNTQLGCLSVHSPHLQPGTTNYSPLMQDQLTWAVSNLKCKTLGLSLTDWYGYRWQVTKYGGMDAEEARRLKELEVENARLKKLLAEAHLDLEALKIGFGVKR